MITNNNVVHEMRCLHFLLRMVYKRIKYVNLYTIILHNIMCYYIISYYNMYTHGSRNTFTRMVVCILSPEKCRIFALKYLNTTRLCFDSVYR